MTPDCERKGKWIRGCRFEARYDHPRVTHPVQIETTGGRGMSEAMAERLFDKMLPRTYVADICRTCGAIRKREAV